MSSIGTGFTLTYDEIESLKALGRSQGMTEPSTIHFDPKLHLAMTPGSKTMNYLGKNTDRSDLSWGQMKLFTCLLEFLTLKYNPSVHDNPVLVYVGAAPGINLSLIMDMFDVFDYELYDSEQFDKSVQDRASVPGSKVKIFQRYFEDSDAQALSQRRNVFFVSDIRNLGYQIDYDKVSEKCESMVWKDMEMQQSWVQTINPAWSMLKFRPPYYDSLTVNMFKGKAIVYLKGTIMYQSFAKSKSSETRLYVKGVDPIPGVESDNPIPTIEYNFEIYESMIMYHNSIIRETDFTKFYSVLHEHDTILRDINRGLIPDWDTTKLLWLLKVYMKRSGASGSFEEVMILIDHIDETLKNRMVGRKSRTKSSKKYGLASRHR